MFRIRPDYYNFEQHANPGNDFKTGVRNFVTERAGAYIGPGKSFTIEFTGTFQKPKNY
jgi:hypothetical protein